MGNIKESRRNAVNKYRKQGTHALVIHFPNAEYAEIDAYCKHINSPVATFVRKQIHKAIDSDSSFVYTPINKSELDVSD